MRSIVTVSFALFAGSALAVTAGRAAPDFSVADSNGKTVKLSDYKGKFVVLEWVNFECPFVRKHYGSENMQKLQKAYTEKDVVWITICSSAPGKQGNFTGPETKELMEERGAAPTRYLLDPNGVAGRAYGAKTTPHMFVIDEKGVLRYRGALDNTPFGKVKAGEEPVNFVEAALESIEGGKPVAKPETKSYG